MKRTTSDKALRNTKQRQYLLDLLRSTHSHPNAFWLYDNMKPSFPNLSLSTVYRNLGVLEQQGQLQRITCERTFDRYDANTTMHSHFHCKECGCVYDIDAGTFEKNVLSRARSNGHKLQGCHITFYGICEKCAKDRAKK